MTTPHLHCPDFPCSDVVHARFTLPHLPPDPASIRLVVIAEAPPAEPGDWFWASPESFFWQTTGRAFAEAGLDVGGADHLAEHGIHLTTAVKCAKTGHGVATGTVAACAQRILEQELSAFAGAKAIALMGDAAIKALNVVARRRDGTRVVPSGPTWRIRGVYDWGDVKVVPSYLFTGRSYLIEAAKRAMIAEDLRTALGIAGVA